MPRYAGVFRYHRYSDGSIRSAAFRTGCKLAVVDGTGKVLDTVVIYPTAPQNKVAESKKILKDFIK